MADRGEILIENKIKTFFPENSESDHVTVFPTVGCFFLHRYIFIMLFLLNTTSTFGRDESATNHLSNILTNYCYFKTHENH